MNSKFGNLELSDSEGDKFEILLFHGVCDSMWRFGLWLSEFDVLYDYFDLRVSMIGIMLSRAQLT